MNNKTFWTELSWVAFILLLCIFLPSAYIGYRLGIETCKAHQVQELQGNDINTMAEPKGE